MEQCSNVKSFNRLTFGGAEIARPDNARPDNAAPDMYTKSSRKLRKCSSCHNLMKPVRRPCQQWRRQRQKFIQCFYWI